MVLNKASSIVLPVTAVAMVLAFGGVISSAIVAMELAVAIVALIQFWQDGYSRLSKAASLVLCVLIVIPLLQSIPLSANLIRHLSLARVRNLGDVDLHATRAAALRLACYMLVFVMAFQNYRQHRGTAVLVWTLVVIGVFEALYGTVQYLTGWQYIFTYVKQYSTEEASGTYINRNHFAGLLEMVLPFVLARILIPRRSLEKMRLSDFRRTVASPLGSTLLRDTLFLGMIIVGLVLSRSRMGMAAGFVGVLVVAAISYFRNRHRSAILIAFVVIGIPLAYSAWIGIGPVVERFNALRHGGFSDEVRIPIWRDSIEIIREYPLLGTGLGTYRWASLHYQTSGLRLIYEHAHNDYLEFASEIGLPATLFFFGSLWILAAKLMIAGASSRSVDAVVAAGCAGALSSLLIHSAVDFNFQIPANAFVFAWISGTAAGIISRGIGGSSSDRRRMFLEDAQLTMIDEGCPRQAIGVSVKSASS